MKQDEKFTGLSRREKIVEVLETEYEATVKELASRYLVSEMTIRRDLHYLEEIGIVAVHYGGASLKKERMMTPSFSNRDKKENPYKHAIGRMAASKVKEGDTIFLDVSSTVLYILRYLPDIHLTVITNSMPVIEQLYQNKKINLIIAPGKYDPDMAGTADFATLEYIRKYHADKAFIGTMASNPQFGAACSDEIEGAIKHQMRSNADFSYLMVDHTKFERSAPIFHDDLEEYSYILTDSNIDEKVQSEVIKKNRNLIICHV